MPKFFKQEEKKPFSYSTIVEVRKGSSNYTGWIIGIIVVILISGVALLFFNN